MIDNHMFHEMVSPILSSTGSLGRHQMYILSQPVYKDQDSVIAIFGLGKTSHKVCSNSMPTLRWHANRLQKSCGFHRRIFVPLTYHTATQISMYFSCHVWPVKIALEVLQCFSISQMPCMWHIMEALHDTLTQFLVVWDCDLVTSPP